MKIGGPTKISCKSNQSDLSTAGTTIIISDEIKNGAADHTGQGINAYILANHTDSYFQNEDVRNAITRAFKLSSLNGWALTIELQKGILAGHNRKVVKTVITLCRAKEIRQKTFALKLTSPFQFYRMGPIDIAKELEITRNFNEDPFFNQHYSKTLAVANYAIDQNFRMEISKTDEGWISALDKAPNLDYSLQLDTWIEGVKALELIRKVSKSQIHPDKRRSVIKRIIKRISMTAFEGWRSLRMDGVGLIFDISPDDVIFVAQPGDNIFQIAESGEVVFIDADGGRSMGGFNKLAEALNKSQCFVERLG